MKITKKDVIRLLDHCYEEMDLGQMYHDIRIGNETIEVDITLDIGPPIKGTVTMETDWALSCLKDLDKEHK